MTADVIQLDSKRPRIVEWLRCMFCGTEHVQKHTVGPHLRYFGDCPGCDEEASVPLWQVVR